MIAKAGTGKIGLEAVCDDVAQIDETSTHCRLPAVEEPEHDTSGAVAGRGAIARSR
jgi:hypothetical protein